MYIAKDPIRSREVRCYQEAQRQGLLLTKSKRAADRGSWFIFHPTQGLVAGGPGGTLEDVERYLGRTEAVERRFGHSA